MLIIFLSHTNFLSKSIDGKDSQYVEIFQLIVTCQTTHNYKLFIALFKDTNDLKDNQKKINYLSNIIIATIILERQLR